MKIGMMNFPAADVIREIYFAAENGFDFVDLTIEPPLAYYDKNNPGEIKSALNKLGLDVIGHTAYYLPIGSPVKTVRETAVCEIIKCMSFFKSIGADKINIHPDFNQPNFFSSEEKTLFNIESLKKIVCEGQRNGITVMLENLNSGITEFEEIFSAIPELKFHFDMGHANLCPGPVDMEKMIRRFYDRLTHVHMSDNKGGYGDLHIPLGTGNLDWKRGVKLLKDFGYNGTITLEIFSNDRNYLILSKEKLKSFWSRC